MDKPQRLARRHESRSAEFYGARLTPASGSRDAKGDAETDDELFEFKHTERLSYGIKMSAWRRHRAAAIISGKRPVMEVEYTRPDGTNPEYVVVIDRDDYLAMRAQIESLRAFRHAVAD